MNRYDKPSIRRFLLWAFALAWALQGLGIYLLLQATAENAMIIQLAYTACISLCMFAPGAAVVRVCGGLSGEKTGVRWRVRSRRVLGFAALAFALITALTLLGAALYFALFPAHYSLERLAAALGPAAQGTGLPLVPFYVLYTIGASVPGALVNVFFALGEEVGWTGYLAPALAQHVGKRRAVLLRGVIWGLWHAPLIVLAGYQYGVGYWGTPLTGVLAMALFTMGMGVLMTWLYESAESIWAPAFAHGALNAMAGGPLLLLAPGMTHYLLGPSLAGVISGVPLFVLAALLLRRMK